MKIYLLDINKNMTYAWQQYFKGQEGIEIVNAYFQDFMQKHPEVEGIVSPANSFGLMDGGYDKAIIDYLGQRAQTNVLTVLDLVYKGYQPVGTCLAIPFSRYTILHTPTMRTPEPIIDYRVIYDCMRSCLLKARELKLEAIVVPAFGGLTGRVPYETIAEMMLLAYTHLDDQVPEMNWGYACFVAKNLRAASK